MLTENQVSLLKVHEWLAIAVVIGILAGLAFLTTFSGRGESRQEGINPSLTKVKGFDVLIQGAVERPGIYHLESEMKMKDLLAIAEVRQEADLRRLKLDAMVKKGRVVRVPVRMMITVHLKGAVKQEGALRIPKGSKMEDLLELAEFDEDADLKVVRKKRRLKDDEEIIVPFQHPLKASQKLVLSKRRKKRERCCEKMQDSGNLAISSCKTWCFEAEFLWLPCKEHISCVPLHL